MASKKKDDRLPKRYVNLGEGEDTLAIYRIIPVEWLFEWLATGRNVLARPEAWDDPFDGWVGERAPRQGFYAQCWTLHRQTDAMWRIYSPNNNGVRIRSRINFLIESLRTAPEVHDGAMCFIGRVDYRGRKQVEAAAEELSTKGGSIKKHVRALLLKRKAFAHEREVRLVYRAGRADDDAHLFRYTCDARETLDELTFDPRMPDRVYDAFRQHLLRMGIGEDRISKSGLYTGPQSV